MTGGLRHGKHGRSVLAAVLWFAAGAHAADDIFDFSLSELSQMQLVTIATGSVTPIDRAPATAYVVTASDIRNMGARTLDDVLASVPGIHVSASSLNRLDSVYSIRGIHTGFNPHVLLLLNGVPVQYSLQSSRPMLLRLSMAGVERIEVIRGPGSAIYGADAYAGVVNVITRGQNASAIAPAAPVAQAGARAGSFGLTDLWFDTQSQWQGLDVAWSGSYLTSNGDKGRIVDSDLQSQFDQMLGTQASLAPGALATAYESLDTRLALGGERWRSHFWGLISRDAGLGAGGAQALDHTGSEDADIFLADINYQINSDPDGWENNLQASYFYYDQNVNFVLFPKNSRLPIGDDGNINFGAQYFHDFPQGVIGRPRSVATEGKVDWIAGYRGWQDHRLRIAVGWRGQDLRTNESKNYGPGVLDAQHIHSASGNGLVNVSHSDYVYLADSSRTIGYFSLQDEWSLPHGLALTTGVRYDEYSDFGSTTNPRVALVWPVNSRATFKLLYGSAFRAPSFSELGYKNNPVSLGSANLRPEKIDTLELSLAYRWNNQWNSQVTLYNYVAKDLIEFTPNADEHSKTARNARDQDGYGMEWELYWQPSNGWKVAASYALSQAEDGDTGAAIADAPGTLAKLSSDMLLAPDWHLQVQWNYAGDRKRAVDDPRAAVANANRFDVTLRRERLLPQVDLTLALRNALNRDVREPSGGEMRHDYPMEGRSAWLELNYNWR